MMGIPLESSVIDGDALACRLRITPEIARYDMAA